MKHDVCNRGVPAEPCRVVVVSNVCDPPTLPHIKVVSWSCGMYGYTVEYICHTFLFSFPSFIFRHHPLRIRYHSSSNWPEETVYTVRRLTGGTVRSTFRWKPQRGSEKGSLYQMMPWMYLVLSRESWHEKHFTGRPLRIR